MTREQIEQAAKERKWRIAVWRGVFGTRHAETDFIAGALHRQPEIDALKADIERYKQDIAEGLKREETARKVIEEKRKSKQ